MPESEPTTPPSPASDREVLRWAARETLPCVVVLPGKRIWGRSYVIDLRETGPRPQLSVAQPADLLTRELRPLQAGESVRLWSVRQGQPFRASGFVLGAGVIESRDAGPVVAATLRLPNRLFDSETTMGRSLRSDEVSVRVAASVLGEDEPDPATTLFERWMDPRGVSEERGGGHLVEVSRRSFTLSLPRGRAPALLPGARLMLRIELPDSELRTDVECRVVVAFPYGQHVLVGMTMGAVADGTSKGEHREVVRRLAELV